MPGLRCLSFKCRPWGTTPAPLLLWPSDFTGPPLPNLERLVIAYPNPQDEIFDHLPPTIRSLSLRYCPHLDVQRSPYEYSTRFDLSLDSTAILSILRRCEALELDYLELEYTTASLDQDDITLLQYISTAFPSLSSLKLFRYRWHILAIPVVSDPYVQIQSLIQG